MAALEAFRIWLSWGRLPELTAEMWDDLLAEYIEHAYDRNTSVELVARTGPALLWSHPRLSGPLRRAFPQAMCALAGWRTLHPPRSRPPIPRELALAMAVLLLRSGRARLGLLLVVLFECYLRASEGLALTAAQIIEGRPGAEGILSSTTLVRHPEELQQPSKTGEYDSSIPLDLQRHHWLAKVLGLTKRCLHPSELVFPFTYRDLYLAVVHAGAELGAGVLSPTPHGLRHGGASHDRAVRCRLLSEVQRRGLWKSPSSVRRYDKHGRLGLQWAQLSTTAQARILGLAAESESAFVSYFEQHWLAPVENAGSLSRSSLAVGTSAGTFDASGPPQSSSTRHTGLMATSSPPRSSRR